MTALLRRTALVLLSVSVARGLASDEQNEQQQLSQHRRTANNNMTPKEKDVIANPVCSSQALLEADISGNQFISRAEYVNLLLDLAPSDCPIIDMWLNDAPLQRTFEELSCLCHEFGGIDGENNCCLQAVGVPMLAAFAAPDSYYPAEYAAQACAMIDQVLVQECPSTAGPTKSPTNAPTTAPTSTPPESITPTFSLGLSISTFDTVLPSASPSVSPTVEDTLEMTEAGELVEVVIEDGHVTTTVAEEHMPTQQPKPEDESLEAANFVDQIEEDIIEEDEIINLEETIKEGDESGRPEEEAFIDDDDGGSNDNASPEHPDPSSPPEEVPSNGSLIESPSDEENSVLQEPAANQTKETPVGIILAALLCVTFSIALALLAVWGRRHGFMENPWKKPREPTVDTTSSDDIETPRRSNRSHSFSSDDEETSTDEDDDPDIERPRVPVKGRKDGVVRAEFQDDLSVWGRRKRRRQERKQRREERRRQSLEQNPPKHQNTITTILSTLEFDLGGGAAGASGSSRPNSLRSMASNKSAGAASVSPKADAVDIFDDRSETSSYDGSPQNYMADTLPLETSIEHWLDQHVKGKSRINADGSIVVDDRSVMSHVSTASKRSTASSRRSQSTSPRKKLQRQPKDPVLQDWNAQRQQINTISSFQRLDYSKLSASVTAAAPSPSTAPYNTASSRSYSPQRSVQDSIGTSTSFSPSQSPKPTNLLSSLSFSPASSPKRPYVTNTSHSVPASPVDKLVVFQETLFLEPGVGHTRASSESSFRHYGNGTETKDSDSPPYTLKSASVRNSASNETNWNPLKLDLVGKHTEHSTRSQPQSAPLAPRLSPDSQEFYDSVLRMEPPEEEDDSRGNAFAFEAARPRNTLAPTERYLV